MMFGATSSCWSWSLSSSRRTRHLPNPWAVKPNMWVRIIFVCGIVITNWPRLGLAEFISWWVNWTTAVELLHTAGMMKTQLIWLVFRDYLFLSSTVHSCSVISQHKPSVWVFYFHSGILVQPASIYYCGQKPAGSQTGGGFDFTMPCVHKDSVARGDSFISTPLFRWNLGLFVRWQPFQDWEWRMKKDVSEMPSGSLTRRGPPVTAHRYSGGWRQVSRAEISVYPHEDFSVWPCFKTTHTPHRPNQLLLMSISSRAGTYITLVLLMGKC